MAGTAGQRGWSATVSGLDQYLHELESLIRRLEPQARRRLANDIGTEIRRRNAQRIRANISPGGAPFTPRQGQPTRKLREGERIRVGQAFIYLGRTAMMRTIKTPASAAAPSRASTQAYNDKYVYGWDFEADGIRKFRRDRIELPDNSERGARMFRKIHRFTYLKKQPLPEGVQVGFPGGLTGYIAAAHQYGADNRPVRELLGYSDEDLRYIQETVVRHLVEA